MPYLAAPCTAGFRHLKKTNKEKKKQGVASASLARWETNVWKGRLVKEHEPHAAPSRKEMQIPTEDVPLGPSLCRSTTRRATRPAMAERRYPACPGPRRSGIAHRGGGLRNFSETNIFTLHVTRHFQNHGMCPFHSTSYWALGNSNYKAT